MAFTGMRNRRIERSAQSAFINCCWKSEIGLAVTDGKHRRNTQSKEQQQFLWDREADGKWIYRHKMSMYICAYGVRMKRKR